MPKTGTYRDAEREVHLFSRICRCADADISSTIETILAIIENMFDEVSDLYQGDLRTLAMAEGACNDALHAAEVRLRALRQAQASDPLVQMFCHSLLYIAWMACNPRHPSKYGKGVMQRVMQRMELMAALALSGYPRGYGITDARSSNLEVLERCLKVVTDDDRGLSGMPLTLIDSIG